VHDKHPEYESTKFAKSYAKELGIRSLELQHHYAHALSVMAEYDLDEEVLAFCFDGTGLGDDGIIWGSEVFLATPKEYKRIYHLDEFLLLGAQKAIKEPKRVAISLLFEFMSFEEIQKLPISKSFSSGELKTLYMMHKKGLNSIKTTSMGRVFDAVYALMGYYETIGFEGESGFIVQSLAQKTTKLYSYTLRDDGVIDIKNMIKEMLCDTKVEIASKFINTIADIVEKIALKHKDKSVVLSGGVFQN
jgi:hydrogenase maturation protein HypF